mgnify:CR=1 FL=1|jgi:uncharacterized coiled-coil protein SlyX
MALVGKISIKQVTEHWDISRPTVMEGINKGKLNGVKDSRGRWEFEVQDVIAWRGEPKSENEAPVNEPTPAAPVQDELIKTLQKQVAQLEGQISTKDEQINRLQDSMRDQTKMLEHHAEREKVQAEQANKSFFKRVFG